MTFTQHINHKGVLLTPKKQPLCRVVPAVLSLFGYTGMFCMDNDGF